MGSTTNTPLTDIPDDLERPEVIAALLKITAKTLMGQRNKGIGPPYVVINRTVRYSRRAVAEWLEAQSAPWLARQRTPQD